MNQQIDCMAIRLNISSNSFDEDEIGGIEDGIVVDDAMMLVPSNINVIDNINDLIDQGNIDGAYTLCNEMDIFPGSIVIANSVNNQELRVCYDEFENFSVFLDDIDVTNDFCDLEVEINYIENIVSTQLTLTTQRHMFSHLNENITIL